MTAAKKNSDVVQNNSKNINNIKSRISQSDIPAYSLEQALRIPRAIADNYAHKPTKPLDVALALNMSLTSSGFRMLTGAAVAYGLTTAGYSASEIAISPLGIRIVRPLQDGEDLTAKREAVLKPRIFMEFLTKYDGSALPKIDIAKNVLLSMGVPQDRRPEVLELILESADSVGFLRQLKEKRYVDLSNTSRIDTATPNYEEDTAYDLRKLAETSSTIAPSSDMTPAIILSENQNRVFITHGKNLEIVSQLKELLQFGSFIPVVAAEHETVSKPVPDKVMDDMRSCYAAIIHVGKEQKLLDQGGSEHIILNQNVLIEIGAAMALYGRRFILLVERGASLPSNLQGLYEVRYEGDRLDYDATMKLLKAFNDFKS